MFVANEHHDQVTILDHAASQILSSFGRVGHQVGEFTHPHNLAVACRGSIYVGEVQWGDRVEKFRIVSRQQESSLAGGTSASDGGSRGFRCSSWYANEPGVEFKVNGKYFAWPLNPQSRWSIPFLSDGGVTIYGASKAR